MTLQELFDEISRTIKRGNSQDAVIPDVVRDAARYLEQNYTFRYMTRFGRWTADPLAAVPERIEMENPLVKKIVKVRVVGDSTIDATETYRDLERVEQDGVTALSKGYVKGYWMEDDDVLNLDAIPDEELRLEIKWAEYTDWPADPESTPKLLARYANLLKAQAMVLMAQELKDKNMEQTWSGRLTMFITAALQAEEEAKHEDRNYVMRPRG